MKKVEKLYQIGLLKPDEKVELINEEIYKMSPIGLRHALVINKLGEIIFKILSLNEELSEKYTVQIQNPLKLSSDTVLQPDVALVRRKFMEESRYPQPQGTELVKEVLDTILSFNKNVKLPLYAKYKIKEVWIINLIDRKVGVYTNFLFTILLIALTLTPNSLASLDCKSPKGFINPSSRISPGCVDSLLNNSIKGFVNFW